MYRSKCDLSLTINSLMIARQTASNRSISWSVIDGFDAPPFLVILNFFLDVTGLT